MDIKVACLYRVSTLPQLTDGDIPLQQNACRAFTATQHGWRIVAEYSEAGVSGYHKSLEQRDVLQTIRRDALSGKFDVLLVYLFDRLGRREDETPFVVEWLAQYGVTVWSVVEGAQHVNGLTDRLTNYIRYWQSGSESAATSLRVAEKHRQMVADGRYRGGAPPFGYKLIRSGETGKNGRKLHKLAINETESTTVQLMYELEREHMIGCYTVASALNERGLFTRFGHKWTSPAVVRTLRNPIYKGDYVSGRVVNTHGKKTRNSADKLIHSREPLTELAIVDATVWDAVNQMIDGRCAKGTGTASYLPLLKGLIYCGYCGGRLTIGGRHKRYDCPRHMRLDECTGAFGYGAVKIDRAVWVEVVQLLKHAESTRGLLSAARAQGIEHITKRTRRLSQERDKLIQAIADTLLYNAPSGEMEALAERLKIVELAYILQKDAIKKTPLTDVFELSADHRKRWLGCLLTRVTVSREEIIIWFNVPARRRTSGLPDRQRV